MEVPLSPEKEARLRDFAIRNGKDASQIVAQSVDHILSKDGRFDDGIEYIRRNARRALRFIIGSEHSTLGSVMTCVAALAVVAALIGWPISLIASKDLKSPNLWFDESGQYWLSLGLHQFTPPLAVAGGWANIVEYGRVMNADPSGFTCLLRLWMDVFGHSPIALRSLPFLFFVLMPILIILAALRFGARPLTAALAGSIPLAAPMLLHYATEVRAYSMEAFAVVFLFFLPCWLSEKSSDRTRVILGCVAAVLVASRYSAFIFGGAACVTALLPLRPFRGAILRGCRFGIPILISATAAYFLFARYQLNGSHHGPSYVEALLLSGKNSAVQLALIRENLVGAYGFPIILFLLGTPLFSWLAPPSLASLRILTNRMAIFCALSMIFTVWASLTGFLPWAVHSRWSIGYQSLSVCCGSMIVIVIGICLNQWAAVWPRKLLVVAASACFALLWSVQVKDALAEERPYYETIASHLEVLARSPHARDLRFFVQFNATPTTRYLVESGPLRGVFSYPKNFYFETQQDIDNKLPISPAKYDVVVLTHFQFSDAYSSRVVDGTAKFIASPQPSGLLLLNK
jgi:hypothetical protein